MLLRHRLAASAGDGNVCDADARLVLVTKANGRTLSRMRERGFAS
jgi:hypothetical protein